MTRFHVLQDQSVLLKIVQPFVAGQEHNLMAGLLQLRGVDAADHTCAKDKDPHRRLPPSAFGHKNAFRSVRIATVQAVQDLMSNTRLHRFDPVPRRVTSVRAKRPETLGPTAELRQKRVP
jgi:hypothetical protein